MRKLALFGAAFAVALGGIGFYTGAEGATTIHVIDKVVQQNFVDHNNNNAPDLGDTFVGTAVDTTPTGAPLGHSGQVCTIVSAQGGGGEIECTITVVLAGGQITFTGIQDIAADRGSFGITGGTGAYRNARGVVDFTNLDEQTTDAFIRLS